MNERMSGWTAAQGWVLALTALASLLVVLDALVVSTALSAIPIDLGATPSPRRLREAPQERLEAVPVPIQND